MLNNVRFIVGAIGLSATGAWMVSGSAQESIEFNLPASTVIQRLNASHRTVEGSGMGSLTVSGESQLTLGKVKISVTRAGSPRAIFCTVAVEATSPAASLANLDCEQSGADENQIKALGSEAMKIVVAEHVLASVLDRPYNTDKVSNEMIAFMAKSAPMLAASLQPPEEKPSDRSQQRVDLDHKVNADFYNDSEPADGEGGGGSADTGDSFE
jgi:hypothetical protein